MFIAILTYKKPLSEVDKYLQAHRDTAKEYEALKLSLLPKFNHNRDAYTDAKTEFVERIVSKRK